MLWKSVQSCQVWDDEGLPARIGKGCVPAGWICQRWAAGSGGPCAAVAICSVQQQPQPRQSLLAPCCSWIQLLHEGQVGQAASASSRPHHELERNWENTHCEQAAGQPGPAAEFARKLIPSIAPLLQIMKIREGIVNC